MSLLSVRLESRLLFPTRHSHSHSLSFPAFRIAVPPPPPQQRISTFSQGGSYFVNDPRMRRRPINSARSSDDDDDDEDRSLDLLVRFIHNVFNKVSKKARKAVRSLLPVPVSPNLVGFSVNGVLVLAFLWILKAFLEVVCTLGSVVFVSILLIRGIWSGVSFIQENRNQKVDDLDVDHHAWNGSQLVT